MFLKSFDLHGFKSFKDRTKLEFSNGITTIVGPNGSGKSNIADAFRWVLGEQRIKALRGNKGEDVIFGGTKVHKALGVASVYMNIDNHDGLLNIPYEEVKIGRKIYRSGESEYTINGNSCRLKDIHELFNDTGLGKDSFSIIGQGEIEKILNAKAEDRRGIIEELAGIVKYRNRKEESLRKIEHSEVNLRRILDIIEELENNYDLLEDSAKKAKYYIEIKELSDKLELNLILNDIFDGDLELEMLTKELNSLKDSISKDQTDLRQMEASYEKNNMSLMSIEENLKFNRNKLMELKDSVNILNTEVITIDNTISNNEDKIRSIEEEISEIENKSLNLEIIYKDKIEKKAQWTALKEEKNKFIKELEIKMQDITKEKNCLLEIGEDIRYSLIDIFQDIAVLHNEIKSVGDEEKALINKEQNSKNERAALELYKKDLADNFNVKVTNLSALEIKMNEFNKDVTGLIKEKEDFIIRKDSLTDERIMLSDKYQQVNSKYKALIDIQREYQGYYAGVRSILQQRDKGTLKGVCGVVGDLIKVDVKFEKAIETALGGSLQDVIVNDVNSAKKAIEYLKKEEKGRATFLPLDTVKTRKLNQEFNKLLNESGVYDIGSKLVKIDAKYKAAIENLLGNVVIVDNMDIGIKISKMANQSLKIVTLTGDQFNPGGSMTGGHSGKINSVLSRNRLVEELGSEVVNLKKQLDDVSNVIESINQQLYPLEGKISAKNIKSKDINDNIINLKHDIDLRQQEINNIDEKINLMGYNVENISDEMIGLNKEKLLLNKKLEEKELEKESKEKFKVGKEKEVKELDLSIETINDEILEEKLSLNTLIEKEKAFNESLEAYYNEQQDIKSLVNKKYTILNDCKIVITNNKSRKEEVLNSSELRQEEYLELQKSLNQSDSLKDGLLATNMELDKIIKENSKKLKVVEDRLHELDIKIAKLETDKLNKITILQEKFQFLPYEVMDKRENIADKKSYIRDLKSYQQKIVSLGVVNIGAIEEFDRVCERLTFLKTQEGDLRKTIDSLIEIINDIDKIMTVRFIEAFDLLNSTFRETYSALFSGGEAYIELTEKNDILNSGIEIFSKPPGKTPKNMSMLSGGERALTALALLFSLLKIKPSPLCIIDEADASLDERNVANFANYLKSYSNNTQFVVISHRQGTIEESDNLYGVTMNKSGISKIISVSLEKHRREKNA
ncbi:MAG: chromosome segregation protein SMC [Firmicutes bacterium]|nr:chromosome segregation protein SMC [Bacillota bacterium]